MPSLSSHLTELRSRLLKSLLAYGAATGLAFYASPTVWKLLLSPLQGLPSVRLVNLSPAEGVIADLYACALAGLLLSSPALLWQAQRFVTPALERHEKRIALPWLWSSWALFVLGMGLAWKFLVPLLLSFFVSYQPGLAAQQWTQSSYAEFLLRFCAGMGLYFQMPALAWLLARWGLLRASHLLAHARLAIFAIFALAALLTPPDAASMMLMGVPMLLVYALSIGVAALAAPREHP